MGEEEGEEEEEEEGGGWGLANRLCVGGGCFRIQVTS